MAPIYQYKCGGCGQTMDVLLTGQETATREKARRCSSCGQPAHYRIAVPAPSMTREAEGYVLRSRNNPRETKIVPFKDAR